MIHALNFTGQRDKDLSEMMELSLRRYCLELGEFERKWTDNIAWGNGAGWEASMIKIEAVKSMIRFGLKDTDYVLCVDSDVIFTSTEVFDHIHTAGILGIPNATKAQTFIGPLNHMSGCAIFLRGDIVKKIGYLKPEELQVVRMQFRSFGLTENEDVVLSYVAQMLGATDQALPGFLFEGNFEEDLQNNSLKSFYHMNYMPTKFLGEFVNGKQDIPRVLKSKGYALW